MAVLDDHDPIFQLSDQIFRLFPGHDHGTIIAALAGCLGVVLERAAMQAAQPPAAARLRYELGQLAAQVIEQRVGRSSRES
jgi:hypothetical protein